MPDTITPTQLATKYRCGTDYFELKVVKFLGPNDSEAYAYCCNMNLDFDGEPQAYAPLNTTLEHWDELEDGGFLRPAVNTLKKQEFDRVKAQIDALKAQQAAAKTPQAAAAFQDQIRDLEAREIIQNYPPRSFRPSRAIAWRTTLSDFSPNPSQASSSSAESAASSPAVRMPISPRILAIRPGRNESIG